MYKIYYVNLLNRIRDKQYRLMMEKVIVLLAALIAASVAADGCGEGLYIFVPIFFTQMSSLCTASHDTLL